MRPALKSVGSRKKTKTRPHERYGQALKKVRAKERVG
jgi:hypothetical protein